MCRGDGTESRIHTVGIVSKGYIMGLEDAVFAKEAVYSTSAVVSSECDLYRIDREVFINILKQTNCWTELQKKA